MRRFGSKPLASTIALAGLLFLQASCESFAHPRKNAACIVHEERKKHIGQVLEFDGCFAGSDFERALVMQQSCTDGLPAYLSEKVIGKMNRAVGKPPDAMPFMGDVSGRFKGILRQQEANPVQFFRDDGVRFEVLDVTSPRNLKGQCLSLQKPRRR